MNLPNFSLDKKVAIITGGAGLLGKQHAIALAEIGANIVIADLDLSRAESTCEELKKEFSVLDFLAVKTDVTNKDSIESLLESTVRHFGRVDVLVNNAALDPKVKGIHDPKVNSQTENSTSEKSRFENFDLETWNLELNVGLTGAFLCSQVIGNWMSFNQAIIEGGVILNIASDLSVIAPDQRLYRKEGLDESKQPVKPVTYSVIKTGLIGLTKYLATYWADKNIRVNAISPGGIFQEQPKEFVEKLTALIPMGRMAEVGEYRSTVQYLCSNASQYMTGQNIVIDGGRSVL